MCHCLGQCTPIPPPSLGTLKVVAGNGTSVGTVMTLLCPARYRPISGGRISCVQENNSIYWSGGAPECKCKTYTNHDAVHLLILDIHETTGIGICMIIMKTINYNGNNLPLNKIH